MKKYFCVSDIHSFYTILIKALHKKGFDEHNQDHILIVLGDIFDRGNESLEVYEFLRSLPKERRILIRGNHEYLLRDLVKKGFPEQHDYHNGTFNTLFQLADIGFKNEKELESARYKELGKNNIRYNSPEYLSINSKYNTLRKKLYKGKVEEILEWINSDEWVNYYELDNYIFVHGWIPCATVPSHYSYQPKEIGYREDWRNATDVEWEDASWGCPWKKAKDGWNKTGKVIVCGHWHTSDFYNHLTKIKKDIYDCPIFQSKKYQLIGLDACTAGSNKINVLVIEQ